MSNTRIILNLLLFKIIIIEIDARHIEKYDACLSHSYVNSIWRPLERSKSYMGEKNKISEEK